MFIDIDYKKRIKKTRIHIAKPNKQIISHIYEYYDGQVDLELGNINELEFSIPYKVESYDGTKLVHNRNIDLIRSKMLLKVSMGNYMEEWFVVDEFEESGEEKDVLHVTAKSLPYELKNKRISGLVVEAGNPEELLDIFLKGTLWKVKHIDDVFLGMYRLFESGDNSNSLNCITEMAKTFGALILWDTKNRELSLVDPLRHGVYRGFKVNYGRLLKSITRTNSPDEMVTRLWVSGNEDLSIQRVNPTGQRYIEDFSYFMFPFERDSDKNTIKSSYFMSDELCHAILDHNELIEQQADTVKELNNDKIEVQSMLVVEESELNTLQLELDNILDLLDVAKSAEDHEAIKLLKEQKSSKEKELELKEGVVKSLQLRLKTIDDELEDIYKTIDEQSNFTEELREELKYYIIEAEWKDDNYIDDEELYRDAWEKFKEIRKPKLVAETSIANIYNSLDEQYYWDKLVLGDYIDIEYSQMNIHYRSKIIKMTLNIDDEDIDLTVANTDELMDDTARLIELLYSNKTATTLIESNKYKWDKINAVEKQVHDIITQEWDATKRKIIAGVHNNVQIGKRGIIVENPMNPNEIIIINSGVIALSNDRGENWKTAMTADGVVAERLIGRIVAGQELLITNSAGTFTMDANGFIVDAKSFTVRSSSSSGNLVDDWNKTGDLVADLMSDNMITPYEKQLLLEEWNRLKVKHDYLSEILYMYFEDGGVNNPEVITFDSKYSELFDYLFTDNQTDGLPLLDPNNMKNTTRINSEIFYNKFNDYRESVPPVEKLIEKQSKILIQEAQDIAKDAKSMIDEISNNVNYKVELTSTNGLIFKNNLIDTELIANVYKGSLNITNTLPNSAFVWKKIDKDGNVDMEWVEEHRGAGNTITVTGDDVFQRATFLCEINIEE